MFTLIIMSNLVLSLLGTVDSQIDDWLDQATSEFRALTLKADIHLQRGEVERFGQVVQASSQSWSRIQSLCVQQSSSVPIDALKRASEFFVDAGQRWCDIGRRDEGVQSISIGVAALVRHLKGIVLLI